VADVAFHTGLADRIGYACRLLRKAQRQGARVRVFGEETELDVLDKALWTFDAQDFVPHLLLKPGAAPAPALHATPLWLTPAGADWPAGLAAAPVWVNLGADVAPGLEGCERMVELVSDDATDLAAARRRWRAYEAAGHTVSHVKAA
jgi:DNA polymerase-3 subunit chi